MSLAEMKLESNSKIRIDFGGGNLSSSVLSIADPEKRAQEINSLKKVPDSFRKIVVVGDRINPWKDENGILYIGIEQFLLDEKAIDM